MLALQIALVTRPRQVLCGHCDEFFLAYGGWISSLDPSWPFYWFDMTSEIPAVSLHRWTEMYGDFLAT